MHVIALYGRKLLAVIHARRSALLDGLGALGQRGLNLVLGLAVSIFLARTLGADGYGRFALFLSLASLLALLAQNGMPTLLTREIAVGIRHADTSRIRGVLVWAFSWSALIALVCVLVTLAIGRIVENSSPLLTAAILIIPAIALTRLCQGALAGFRRIALGQTPIMIVQPGIFLLLVICLPFPALDPHLALLLRAGAEWTAVLVALALLLRYLPTTNTKPKADHYHTWRAAFIPLSLLMITNAVNHHADIQMLGLLKEATDLGQYRVAAQIAAVPMSVLHIVSALIAPRVAAARNHVRDLRLSTALAAWSVFIPASLFALSFALFGAPALAWVFGPGYAGSFVPVVVMACGIALAAAFGPVMVVLNMSGLEKLAARYALISAGVNMLLNIAAIPLWGAGGAALTTALCLVLLHILGWNALRRRIGVRTDILALMPTKTHMPPLQT